jgi:hypothetical protein
MKHGRPVGDWVLLAAGLCVVLSGCGDGAGSVAAASSDIHVAATTPGPTPFVAFVQLEGNSLGGVTGIAFAIQPKPSSASKPVSVSYSVAALQARGFFVAGSETVPVFGLYSGFANQVTISLTFVDGSVQSMPLTLTTAPYTDPTGIYDHPTIVRPRAVGSSLGFDYFAIKSFLGSPVIVDTDGNIRWVLPASAIAPWSRFQDNRFVIGDPNSSDFVLEELDGSTTAVPLQSQALRGFTHNIDAGKTGMVGEFATGTESDSTAAEFSTSGAVLETWDIAALLSAYMQSQGDDPSAFVRPAVDWFHMNATTYDPSDNSLIVSSRENFVIKIDYATGNIIWILGDPTKYWYTFPSLRAKALRLTSGLYPVGQHAVSMTSDGLLMLFNDGLGSLNQPPEAAAGLTRTYSAVSAYAVDPVAMTATESWDFDYGQSLFSPVCSSAYESAAKSILVDYAVANDELTAHLVGLNADHDVVFDIAYATTGCGTSWNAVPVPLDSLHFE